MSLDNEKFNIEIKTAIKVVEKNDVYTSLGFWDGNIKTDVHKDHYIQKLFNHEYFKILLEKMEEGKEYRIDIKITEMLNVSEI